MIWLSKWGWMYLSIHPINGIITILALLVLTPIYTAIVRNDIR